MGNQVAGLVEVWQDPGRHPSAIQGFLHFLGHMADLASRYLRNRLLGEMIGQQELWTKLEVFARQTHESLHPVEVAYRVANDGRRLIDCDRVSVGVRHGKKVVVEAVSGADVVEKRSNLVRRMRGLFEAVIQWGDKLVYNGTKDDSLPPAVLKALDAYLEESNSKLLVVLPLRDDREKDGENKEYKKPPRSALLMECFDPAAAPDQLIARLEVLGRHASSALYNSVEHHRIPFRFLWRPLAKVQDGLGGKTRAIIYGICALVLALAAALYFVPYPLRMDATGQLLPQTRRMVYPGVEGIVVEFRVKPGDKVTEGQYLVRMFDRNLQLKLQELTVDITTSEAHLDALRRQESNAPASDKPRIAAEQQKAEAERGAKNAERQALLAASNAEADRPGYFWLKAPAFPEDDVSSRRPDRQWTVLNWDFRENLLGRPVKPNEPLLRLGDAEGPWEVELKIPQKHYGQVLAAFGGKDGELDVDLLVKSSPTETFDGKLARNKIAGAAEPHRDANDESEPVALASVRIAGDGIQDRIPDNLLLTGTEVHTKVRCGSYRMGYSLFYGVWEFAYEKLFGIF
jgi:hypothetical protein